MSRPLRIIYSAGPGDVIATYRRWVRGEDDPTQLARTYSGMFYDFCQRGGHQAYVISCCGRRDQMNDGTFLIVQRNTLFADGPGPLFYLGQEWAALRLIASALWFKADVAVVACGTASWISLQLLPLFGVAVVPSLHCVLWPKNKSLTALQSFLRRCRVPFFKHSAACVMSISEDVTQQLKQMAHDQQRRVVPFVPNYRSAPFAAIPEPPRERRPFRVLFAGRVDASKGVFDLLKIARRFAAVGRTDVQFDLCGDGPAMTELRREIASASLQQTVRCLGHCDRERMLAMLSQSHIVIVPTTGQFVEGFNKVVVEAVLARRPVITSSVCPSLSYVRNCVVEVPVDDVQAYGDAILKLCDDAAFYESMRHGSAARDLFFDETRSWRASLETVLAEIAESIIEPAGMNSAALIARD